MSARQMYYTDMCVASPRAQGQVSEEHRGVFCAAAKDTGFDVAFSYTAYDEHGEAWCADTGYIWLWVYALGDTGPFWEQFEELKGLH